MSDLLRVTTPVAPKDYNLNQNTKPQTPEQVFDLGNVDYVNKANERDEQLGEQNLKDGGGAGLPKLQAAVTKDPAMSAAMLKGLISGEALEILRQSGTAELLNKVTEFASEIMLLPDADKIAGDLLRQQNEATIFSGELWGALKDMISQNAGTPQGDELGMAVLDFLKAAAAAESRESVLSSISSSLRYLAGETAQSREIMDLLNQTADRLDASNFAEVKQDVQALVHYLGDSLLLSDKTQNLLSLITYNLSRFSGSSTAVSDSFRAVVSMAPDAETAEKLENLFAKFIENSKLPPDVKLAAIEDNPASSAAMSMTMLTERVANAVNSLISHMSDADVNKLSEDLSRQLDELTALLKPDEDEESADTVLNTKAPETAQGAKASETAQGAKAPEAAPSAKTPQAPKTAGNAKADTGAEAVQRTSQKIEVKEGVALLRKILAPLVPDNMKGGVNTLLRSFENDRSLNTLIDRLSVIINRVENMEAKITVAQSINLVLSELAAAEGIQYSPPTTMENMLDFLVKNINDPSLKSLSAMNRGDMLRGLLSAPGVFTPLLHFLVPLNMDGVKAFGELWADPDAGRGTNGGGDDKHLFLCFEIEDAGYFELELYASGKNINVSLLCPPGSERQYLPLKESIPVIASANGYSADKMIISPLVKRRDLNKVFPKLNFSRSGLNVSV